MAWCKKAHRYDDKFSSLPFSEEFFNESERWKCSGCAYEQGYECNQRQKKSDKIR